MVVINCIPLLLIITISMRNRKHILYTHRICVCFYVKSSDSAIAHGASQCFALSQATNKAKHCEASCATALSEDLT